jgi:hypothetical protein
MLIDDGTRGFRHAGTRRNGDGLNGGGHDSQRANCAWTMLPQPAPPIAITRRAVYREAEWPRQLPEKGHLTKTTSVCQNTARCLHCCSLLPDSKTHVTAGGIMPIRFRPILLAAAAAAACGAPAFAQTVNAPVQYWIDLATYSMMGMEEMPDMPAGMMGNVTGMRSQTGRDGRHAAGVGNFGQTKNASMGRWMDTALFTQKKPSGTEATHQVPSGATLGAAPLQLMTPPRESLPAEQRPAEAEKPAGGLIPGLPGGVGDVLKGIFGR